MILEKNDDKRIIRLTNQHQYWLMEVLTLTKKNLPT